MLINIQIFRKSYDKINRIKKWYNSLNNTKITQKELVDYIINEFIDIKQLNYISKDPDSEDIKYKQSAMKYFRIDTNLDPTAKEYIEAIKQYLKKSSESKKNTNDVIIEIGRVYSELHPDVKTILQNNKFIKQSILVEKAMEKSRKEKVKYT